MSLSSQTGRARLVAAVVLVISASAGCSSGSPAQATATAGPATASASTTPVAKAPTAAPTVPSGQTGPAPNPPPAAPQWPSPADCISYNPTTLTVAYAAGVFTVTDGPTQVLRLQGEANGDTGDKGLALAQRFGRHCFLGRTNTREDHNMYVFDYWRDPSGNTPTIADQDDDCSNYNNANLTVEDMGDGNGWRVKDHDHVLQLFDNESDARNGKLVLLKYHEICFLGDSSDNDPDVVSYFL